MRRLQQAYPRQFLVSQNCNNPIFIHLGVLTCNTLSPSAHIAKIMSKANQMMGCIKRSIEFKSKENLIRLFKSLVRPHLDYCQQTWRPYNQKDIESIENVQRRMTQMISSLREDIYEERFTMIGLVSLEMRRLRSDLIEVFKIMQGLEGLKAEDFFIMD